MKSKGITLIALVVTIVVLLILAGITISLVFSENGIISKAREAAEKTNQAVINEQTQMNELAEYMGNMLNGIGGSTTPDEPEDPTKDWDLSKVDPVQSKDETPITVPVPKGYKASEVTGETTVENGFVIYEGEEPVTNESDIETAQTTRNQFVWVPVENVNEIYGTDSAGKKWGKLYEFSTDGIIPLNWTEQNDKMSIIDTSNFCEPNIVNSDSENGITITQLEDEFNSMISSVKKYGGFYIGRYETGNLSYEEGAVVKNNNDIDNQTWYTIYDKSIKIAANENVTTTIIWGCQWDAVLRWMYNSGDEEKKTYTYDSTGKGHYLSNNEGKTIPTGSCDVCKINNIYDMAGNVYDWTMEEDDLDSRGLRGGHCNYNGSTTPASARDNYPTTLGPNGFGSRVSLYINI